MRLIGTVAPVSVSTMLTIVLLTPALAAEGSDRQRDGLLGPVKVATVRNSFIVRSITYDRGGRRTKVTTELVLRTLGKPSVEAYNYNDVGQLSESLFYGTDGELYARSVYWYDSDRRRIARLEASPDGTVKEVELYVPDQQGNRTTLITTSRRGILKHEKYSYDSHHRLTEKVDLLPTESSSTVVRYKYSNNDPYPREERFFDSQGILLETVLLMYDRHGNVTEEKHYDSLGRIMGKDVNSYEHDSHGNWVVKRTTAWKVTDGKLVTSYEATEKREISYYP